MGTPAAAVPCLERLAADGHKILAVYTQPDRPAGRGNKIAPTPVKSAAIARGIEVRQPEKIRTPEAIEAFRELNADLAVVVAYGRILPAEYLQAFALGAINVHFSLLPKYRGAAPVNWAIVNGETETGVTTMRMDTGLDTGDVLLTASTRIGPDETAVELMDRLAVLGAELLAKTLDGIDSIEPKPQDDSQATLAPIMRREDGRVDWSLSATQIGNRIRGFQPFPGSSSTFRGAGVKFWGGTVEETAGAAAPGEILEAVRDRLLIACGVGTALKVTDVQPEGKARMKAADFINGFKPLVGERFGG